MSIDELKNTDVKENADDKVVCRFSFTPEEYCWSFGRYLSDCNCENCAHKDECSGYNG